MLYMSFLNFSKEVASDLTLSEKLNSILTTCVAGFALVFLVLGIIWFILAIFGRLFDKSKKPEAKKTEAPVQTVPPAPAPAAVAPVNNDAEVVAAIVAAISAYTGKSASGFRVVSFRKKH